ncbi:hypothetical protein QE152_g41569, partial [Popillia japonica]
VGPVSVQIVNATSEQDSLSSGERTGTSPAPNPAAGRRTPGNVVLRRIRHLEIVRCAQVLLERGQLPIEGARPVVGRRIRHLEIVRCAQVLLERGQLPIEGARPVVGRPRSWPPTIAGGSLLRVGLLESAALSG